MEKIQRFSSDNGLKIIEIIQDSDGTYLLHKFIVKYDSEEKQSYEVREYPGPTGRFGDFGSAVKEAKSLLEKER